MKKTEKFLTKISENIITEILSNIIIMILTVTPSVIYMLNNTNLLSFIYLGICFFIVIYLIVKFYLNIKKEIDIKNEVIKKELILIDISNDVQNYLRKHPKLGTPIIKHEEIIKDIFYSLHEKYNNMTINDFKTQISKKYNEFNRNIK